MKRSLQGMREQPCRLTLLTTLPGKLLQCICLSLDSALHFRRARALHLIVSGFCTALPANFCIALDCFRDLHCTSGELLHCIFLFPGSALHSRRTFALHLIVSGICTALPANFCSAFDCFRVLHCTPGLLGRGKAVQIPELRQVHCRQAAERHCRARN